MPIDIDNYENKKNMKEETREKKEAIINMLIEYTANMIECSVISEYINKDEQVVIEVLRNFRKEWDNAECNEEGPTATQDKKLDSILFQTYRELITL